MPLCCRRIVQIIRGVAPPPHVDHLATTVLWTIRLCVHYVFKVILSLSELKLGADMGDMEMQHQSP